MLLNRIEYALMNNFMLVAIRRGFEARRLLRMGGAIHNGAALEVKCGRGVGTELILNRFGAATVDAFDLDPTMVARARKRLVQRGTHARFWVGDVTAIAAPDSTYDAVFDFGIIHHVPNWRAALTEIRRVLKPGARLYAEEMLRHFVVHPLTRTFLEHPQQDRFDFEDFLQALHETALTPIALEHWGETVGWFVAERPAAA